MKIKWMCQITSFLVERIREWCPIFLPFVGVGGGFRRGLWGGFLFMLITGQMLAQQPVNVSSVNTEYDDYKPAISADEAFFATTVSVRGNSASESSQEDMMIFQRDSVLTWRLDTVLTAQINTPFNEGSPAFSVDGRYFFFVAADRPDGLGSCDIYYVVRHGNRFSRPIHPEAPLNTRYWESNPSLSADGRTLYFTSNRPGGLGGMDIWQCRVALAQDGTLRFSNATNPGSPINTDKNESSPFIHPDNQTLYFASDGHQGFGKNDIVFSRKDAAGHWQSPQNMGSTINTPGDDTGFIVETSGQFGYFSSNGIENNGRNRDIYRIELPAECRPQPVRCVSGMISAAGDNRPLQALVDLTDLSTGKVVSSAFCDDATGNYSVCYPAKGNFSLTFSARARLFQSVVLNDTVNHFVTQLEPIEKGKKVTLNNLYFDFNSYQIQDKSLPELNRLGRFLVEYPTVTLEIAGHTDSIGSAAYNQQLSEQRAKAVVDYLVKGGIEAQRLTYKGYGATQPVAGNDTEQGRALNRRTEAVIVSTQ